MDEIRGEETILDSTNKKTRGRGEEGVPRRRELVEAIEREMIPLLSIKTNDLWKKKMMNFFFFFP